MKDKKIAVDMFSGTGSATDPFRESKQWRVFDIELNEREAVDFDSSRIDLEKDIMNVRSEELPENVDFIWASPPCTKMSIARFWDNWTEEGLPQNRDAVNHTAIAYQALYLVQEMEPEYWFLENPRGIMRKVLPISPQETVTYCQYGFEWQKPTDLFGRHPPSFNYRSCSPGDNCHQESGRGYSSGKMKNHVRDPVERSKIPQELAQEVFRSVNNPGLETTQQKLGETKV